MLKPGQKVVWAKPDSLVTRPHASVVGKGPFLVREAFERGTMVTLDFGTSRSGYSDVSWPESWFAPYAEQ